ncbi:MAG: hypothetical protein AAFU77_00770 [Myxococcota bacterium]
MKTDHRKKKREDEERVVQAIIAFFSGNSEQTWRVTDREVQVGESEKNFDFEISDGHTHVAVEVTHCLEDPEQPFNDAKWHKLMKAVEEYLRSKGYNDLRLGTYGPKSARSKKTFDEDVQSFANRIIDLGESPQVAKTSERSVGTTKVFEFRTSRTSMASTPVITPWGSERPLLGALTTLSPRLLTARGSNLRWIISTDAYRSRFEGELPESTVSALWH